MRKLIIILSFAAPVISSAQNSNRFNPKAGLSIIGGVQHNKNIEASAPVYGIEFSMECPLDQGKKNHTRQKISIVRQDGDHYKSVSAEINPQYKMISTSSFELSAGPVAGMIFTKQRETNKPVFNYGVGAGAVYYLNKFFIGIESRHAMTKKISFDRNIEESEIHGTGNLNSLRTFIKLGYRLSK